MSAPTDEKSRPPVAQESGIENTGKRSKRTTKQQAARPDGFSTHIKANFPEVEAAIIGHALVDVAHVAELIKLGVESASFYDHANAAIWCAVAKCKHGMVEVIEYLRTNKADVLADRINAFVNDAPVTSADIPWMVGKLHEARKRRELHTLGMKLIEGAADGDLPTVIESMRQNINQIEGGTDGHKAKGREIAPAEITRWLQTTPPPHDPVFVEMVDMMRLGVCIAKSKMRKTFFIIQSALCLATGRDFIGWKVAKRRKVMLVQFEVHERDTHERLSRIADGLNISPEDIEGRLIVYNAKATTWDSGGIEAIRDIGRIAAREKVEVLIVDPLFRIQNEGDESIEHLRPLVLAFDKISADTGAFVWIVHHDTKGQSGDRDHFDRGSGSNVVGRAAYWQCTLTPHENGDPNFACVETGGNGYPGTDPITIEFTNGFFTHRPDIYAAKQTSATRVKARLPDIAPLKAHALTIVGGDAVTLESFTFKFQKQTGLSEKRERQVRNELIAAEVLKLSEREPSQGGKKYIGTPEAVDALVSSWKANNQ